MINYYPERVTNYQCPECEQYTAEKYWEEAYGINKHYKCNNCEHSWHVGPERKDRKE